MSPAVALQAVVVGLAAGAVYGLVALGFTLCHRLVRVFNFAHGDLVVSSVLVAVLVTVGRTAVVSEWSWLGGLVVCAVTLLTGAVLGAVVHRFAVRPYTGSDALGWVAATLAVGLLLRAVLGLVLTREAYHVPDPLRLPTTLVRLPGDAVVPVRLFVVIALGVAVGVAVQRLVVGSRMGKAMRAVADDREAAQLVGIAPDHAVLLAFVIAGLLAGFAGLLYAPAAPVTIGSGVVLGLKGVAAALLGRLGSLGGALSAGLALGVAESLVVVSRLGPAYRDSFVLAVLVVLLAVSRQSEPELVE